MVIHPLTRPTDMYPDATATWITMSDGTRVKIENPCPKCGSETQYIYKTRMYKCKKCRRSWTEKAIKVGVVAPELTAAQKRQIRNRR